MRFQFEWQHVASSARMSGSDGLLHVLRALDGFEAAAGAWEAALLPARVEGYDPSMLDMLCLTGRVAWSRLSRATSPSRVVRATPIALCLHEHAAMWRRTVNASLGKAMVCSVSSPSACWSS